MTGAGLLPHDKYHVRKFCQGSISPLDLSEGEFSSILALPLGFFAHPIKLAQTATLSDYGLNLSNA
jgi:hypothetical protein